jgi:PAS domain S-box-containing protein
MTRTNSIPELFSHERATATAASLDWTLHPPHDGVGKPQIRRDVIAMRAYQKWLRRGRPHGTQLQDWLEAEAELQEIHELAEQLAQTDGPPQSSLDQAAPADNAREQLEEALNNSEALYRALVEHLPVRVMRKDLHGRFTFANQAFCTSVKRSPDQVIGKTDLDFYPGELAQKYIYDDRRVLETREVFEAIEEHKDPDGEPTYVQVLKTPLVNGKGDAFGVQCIYWDITARKQAETELARTAVEFQVARKIQQKLFPKGIPRVPGLDIGVATFGFDIDGASYPAEAIGGDYYDFLPLGHGSLGIAIGDVSGHGFGPALLMAETRALLRAFAQTQDDPSAILHLINRVLVPDIESDRFITLLLARLDPRARTLVYSSAGHQPGYLLDAGGKVKRTLPSTGFPLGILEETDFPSSAEIPLQPGDIVLLMTDGIVEARAPDGTVFGQQRPLDLVRVYSQATARQIVDNLYYAVRAFSHALPQYDDITVTVIKVHACQ